MSRGKSAPRLALFRLGFRPFYLLAAALALVAVPLWVATLAAQVDLAPVLSPVMWHAHEMLFGFAIAVIVGFLLTATKAWTNLVTPRDGHLAALALIWICGRITAFSDFYVVYAVVDSIFLPVVAVAVFDVLHRARNMRNMPLVLILTALSVLNIAFHIANIGAIQLEPKRVLYAVLALITIIECIIAGRVIPAFTMSANLGLKINESKALNFATMAFTVIAFLLWLIEAPQAYTATTLLSAAVLHITKISKWNTKKTFDKPILLILHIAYMWIPFGLLLMALSATGTIQASVGVHALAVGATSGLIVGMITRTARGHTGRPLKASRTEVAMYVVITLVAMGRIFAYILPHEYYIDALCAVAAMWAAVFAAYLWLYTPWLMKPRLDGKDG